VPALNSAMFPHQQHTTEFALRTGCAAAFLDTGLGKSLCALDWGRVIVEHTNKPVLMLAPLAVGPQHQREADKFGIEAKYIRDPSEIRGGAAIWITNYERVEKFDTSMFGGIVLDESSVIKNFTGATTRQMIELFKNTPFRLACTATPAPNDHMELGQHCQFLGVMNSNEMLSRWFIADQTNMGKYRLKRAAINPFWDWVASWARCISKPSDVGFSDDGFILPELKMFEHIVRADITIDSGEEKNGQSRLFRVPETSATSIHREKRLSAAMRAEVIANVVAAEPNEPWVIWCDTDYEADELTARIPDAIEVRGSMSAAMKEERLVAFSTGQIGKIITKASIAGFGLNWQHCRRMAFPGISFSYESFYQAVRRCWRFGQTSEVHAHVAMADTERSIWNVVSRKGHDHDNMKANMTAAMRRAMAKNKVFQDYMPVANFACPVWMRENFK
jgi:hypothetical protein